MGERRGAIDVYEAARSDGASSWQTFRYITLALLGPTIALSITGSLLACDQFFILTRGGPDGSTVSMVMVIFREGFTRFNLGSAAAISVLALVELYRATGEERYLEQARPFVERRGRPALADIERGRVYFQDDMPIRDAVAFRGHAVRALYLASGAVDLAVETGDAELLAAIERQ